MNLGSDLSAPQETTSVLWQGQLLAHTFRLISVAKSQPEPGEPPVRFIVEELTTVGGDKPEEVPLPMGQLPLIEGMPGAEALGWMAGGIFQAALVRGRRGVLDLLFALAEQCPGVVSEEVKQATGMNGVPIVPVVRYLESKLDPAFRNAVKLSFAGGKFHIALEAPGFEPIAITGAGLDSEAQAEVKAAQLARLLSAICGRETVAEAGATS